MEKVTRNFGLVIVMLLMAIQTMAQVPNAFKYQAVIRNTLGQILSSQTINLRVSVIKDNPNGTTVYSEGFNQIKTNLFGIINLEIGRGQVYSGDFSKVDWGNGIYFVKIEIDLKGNGVYEVASNSQLLAVPYALYAGNTPLTITGTGSVQVTGTFPNYNIYSPIWDSNSFAKEYQTLSLKGNILSISNGNSVTLTYSNIFKPFNASPPMIDGEVAFWSTSAMSWVANPGFSFLDAPQYLGIGIANPQQSLDIEGNFQLPNTTSSSQGIIYKNGYPFIHNYGTNNTFIGVNSGNLSTIGTDLTGTGYEALYSNTSGSYNSAFGSQALYTNTSGYGNTGIGYMADVSTYNLTNATAIGYGAIVTSNNEMRLGNSNIQSLYCMGAYNAVYTGPPNLYVDNNGQIMRSSGYSSGAGITVIGSAISLTSVTGDINCSATNLMTVNGILGHTIDPYVTLSNGMALIYNGEGIWEPSTVNSYSAGVGLSLTGSVFSHLAHTGDAIGATSLAVVGIQGVAVSNTPPNDGDALIYNLGIGGYVPTAVATISSSPPCQHSQNWVAYYCDNTGLIGGNTNFQWNSSALKLQPSNIELPSNSSINGIKIGNIYKNGDLYIHTNGGWSCFFAGDNAGNTNPNNTGNANTGVGYQALTQITSGSDNTANGYWALHSNTTGSYNTASGVAAISVNTSGSDNTGIGYHALASNTTGSDNTATGYEALNGNTYGIDNVAIGTQALYLNTYGNYNTATGYYALINNTTGSENAAYGISALASNSSGAENMAIGPYTLYTNSTGNFNTAIGYSGLYLNSTGTNNSAIGSYTLYNNTTGSYNIGYGERVLRYNTTGSNNIGIGTYTLYNNSTGSYNTAVGYNALLNNTTNGNNAFGNSALFSNTTGTGNIGIGTSSLYGSTTGSNNVGIGNNALLYNSLGSGNTAIGHNAISNGTNISYNTAVGENTLSNISSSSYNVAVGYCALQAHQSNDYNNAIGSYALFEDISGEYNNAFGGYALENHTSGNENTAIGDNALNTDQTGAGNTAVGYYSLSHVNGGNYNTAIGYSADITGATFTNSTAIGNGANAISSNEMRLGNNSVRTLYCFGALANLAAGSTLSVSGATGQIGIVGSSIRYKENVVDITLNTSKIYDLKPVSYTSKIDHQEYFGLIAEEVEKIFPELVDYAKSRFVIPGSISDELIPNGVKYSMLGVLMLNEMKKIKQQVDKHEDNFTYMKQQIDELKSENQQLRIKFESENQKLKSEIDQIKQLLKKKRNKI